MGGSQSTSTTASFTAISTKVTSDVIKKCMVTATQDQLLEVSAGGDITLGDIGQKQGVSIDMKCAMSSETQNEIKNAVANALTQAAEAKGSGILSAVGGSGSTTNAYITTVLNNEVSMKDVQETVSGAMQRQKISINAGGNAIIGNVTQEQTASLIAEMIMSSRGYTSAIGTIASQVDQKSTAITTNPIQEMLQGIGQMVEGVTSVITKPMMYIFILIVIIVLGIVLVKIVRSRSQVVTEEVVEEKSGAYDGTLLGSAMAF